MSKSLVRRLLVVIVTVGTILMNALANILPFNNLTTGQVSADFDNYFVPEGYVFSIWGVIYLGLVLYTVYQLLAAQADNPRLKAIAPAYIISALANAVWLLFWHYKLLPFSMLAMLIILVCLLYIYLKLNIGKSQVSKGERWLVHLPFSIYLGWISVATVANGGAWLSQTNWNAFGISAPVWAVVMMAVALVLGALMALLRRDIAYDLVIIWALVGIGVNKLSTPPVVVAAMAFVFAALMLVCLVVVLFVRPSRNQPA